MYIERGTLIVWAISVLMESLIVFFPESLRLSIQQGVEYYIFNGVIVAVSAYILVRLVFSKK